MENNKLITYLEDGKSTKLSGYFASYMENRDRAYELKAIVRYIDEKSSFKMLNRLLDLNKNLIDHFTPFSLHSVNFLSMCIESKRFNIEVIDKLGFTALMRCCSRPESMVGDIPEMVSLLLKGGADRNKTCDAAYQFPKLVKYGHTPLMMAADCDSENVIKLLLKNGADPDLKNNLGETALDRAKDKNRNNALKALEMNVRDNQ